MPEWTAMDSAEQLGLFTLVEAVIRFRRIHAIRYMGSGEQSVPRRRHAAVVEQPSR